MTLFLLFKKIKRRYKWLKRYARYYFVRALFPLMRFVPEAVCLRAGILLGSAAFYVCRKLRRIALENLRVAFPGKSAAELESIVRSMFVNMGLALFEILKLPFCGKDPLARIEFEGEENLRAALARGRGAIVLTGHIDNWEVLAWTLGQKGYSGAVIAKNYKFSAYTRLINGFRASYGVFALARDGALREALKILRRGGFVGILPDQDIKKLPGVFVDFFGRPAYSSTGPVLIAKASGAPIVPFFIHRTTRRFMAHRVTYLPELPFTADSDRDREMLVNTQAWSRVVEDWIRRYPDEWVWFHRRWKTQPSSDL